MQTTLTYDADGNRILTLYKTGTTETSRVYTPFPDYEKTVAGSVVTERTSYTLAGQLIATRVRTGMTGAGSLSYAYTDHLGSVAAWANSDGTFVTGSLARYEPFGSYRTKPATTANPGISDRGFTGHKQNNTGDNDIGLIYMNARYYLPEVGRFISADTIVPEPQNPQSYNRYSYARNDPVDLADPSGHMETDGCEYVEGCSMTEVERRESIAGYAKALRWSSTEETTAIDILAQLMDFAALYGTTTKEWANDLSFVLGNATNFL